MRSIIRKKVKHNAIELSNHFTYYSLIRFTMSSMLMMIFASIYTVVDGFFVSNYVGSTPFSALNLIVPFIMFFSAIGFMFGAGGSALVALTLGLGEEKKANGIFSFIIYTALGLGILLSIIGFIFTPQVAVLLGASDEMLPYCIIYARVSFVGLPAFMLQNCFQSFMITAERPQLGLKITLIAGITNMILDALFMGFFGWGLWSAALATITGQFIGGLVPLFYFFRPNGSKLRLGKPLLDFSALGKAVVNGSSEFCSNVSMSIVNMLYNFQLMKFAGEQGVSAYGIIMYTNFVFIGIFMGYSMGVAPVAGYNLGAGNYDELKNVFKRSIKLVAGACFVMTVVSLLAAGFMAGIFAKNDAGLYEMTRHAILIYSIAYLFVGWSVFSSAFFTGLNNGVISAAISFLRTLAFQIIAVLILPVFFGLNGVWVAIVVAEGMAFVFSLRCLLKYRNRYHYV